MKGVKTPTQFVNWLWKSGQLENWKNLADIQKIMSSQRYTFSDDALRMALMRSKYIASISKLRTTFYRQKYPAKIDEKTNDINHVLNSLHPEIKNVSLTLSNDRHYPQSISEAFKKINNMVKNKSGESSLDGKNLMLKVFSVNSPILKINQLKTQSDKDEQEGFMHLFAGAVQGIRNPHAHEQIINQDPLLTLEYLCLASLLAKIIDKSHK